MEKGYNNTKKREPYKNDSTFSPDSGSFSTGSLGLPVVDTSFQLDETEKIDPRKCVTIVGTNVVGNDKVYITLLNNITKKQQTITTDAAYNDVFTLSNRNAEASKFVDEAVNDAKASSVKDQFSYSPRNESTPYVNTQAVQPQSGDETQNQELALNRKNGEYSISEADKKGAHYVNNATSDENMFGMDPYHRDTVRNEWREGGNFNGMSFNATRNLARAADRLNNREWWKPGESRVWSARSGNVTGSAGYAYKKQPIQTWETRQMDKQNELDKRMKEADVDRAAKVLDYNVDARMKADQLTYDTIANYLKGNQTITEQVADAITTIKMIQPGSTQMQQFLQDFTIKCNINEGIFYSNMAMRIANNQSPVKALLFLGAVGRATQLGVPDYFIGDYIPDQIRKRLAEDPDADILEFIIQYLSEIFNIQNKSQDEADYKAGGSGTTTTGTATTSGSKSGRTKGLKS